MKKALLTLVCLWLTGFREVRAQWVEIPDSNFVAYLQQWFPTCMNGKQMDTTCAGIVGTRGLVCGGAGIHDLDGIQYFDSLTTLVCGYNPITVLPALPASVRELQCHVSSLTTITSLPDSLRWLACFLNSLTSLPTLPASLTELSCWGNSITALPPLPASLKRLECGSNSLTVLPTLPNSLEVLWCGGNSLTALPTLPASLKGLWCNNNPLGALPSLPDSLIVLWCFHDSLTTLPVLPPYLTHLYCNNNFLTGLPTLPDSLYQLRCEYNSLTALPDLPETLTEFDCSFNPDLKCFPVYRKFSGRVDSWFNINNTGITCFPNKIEHPYTDFIWGIDTVPICDSTNNPNGCLMFSSIPEQTSPSEIKISPNPATSQLFIQTSNFLPQTISIFDMSGRKVMEEKYSPQIDISALQPGGYFMELKNKETVVRKRWVKIN